MTNKALAGRGKALPEERALPRLLQTDQNHTLKYGSRSRTFSPTGV